MWNREAIDVTAKEHGYFPKAFTWRGRRHAVSAVEQCWTVAEQDWMHRVLKHFTVPCMETFMNEFDQETNIIRSIFAVLAGNFVWTVMWIGSNAILTNLNPTLYEGRVEDVSVLSFTILRSVLFSIIAGDLTAWIAHWGEIKHAVALGVLQLTFGIVVSAQMFNVLPMWYHLIFNFLLIPGSVLGGWLRAMKFQRAQVNVEVRQGAEQIKDILCL